MDSLQELLSDAYDTSDELILDIHDLLLEEVSGEQWVVASKLIDLLKNLDIDLIVLAGFLWLIPKNLLQEYPGRIVNIHPAILPKYGGKGMYGDHVHKAIMDAKEPEGGITIHYVNENYDEGEYIYQAKYRIDKGDNLEMIKFKGQQLEHLHYPRIVESLIKKIKK
ncbi:MAG: phosphoribosylglycinamide formyltransferase [Chitinophagaceae bacterium]|nr:MAG: phosphoribosylglycinamide formyltransferase [Chitinophagaceae bacterium]